MFKLPWRPESASAWVGEDAIARWHNPAPGAMLRIALAPCSPFSVTGELMRESAELARRRGVRLHTHLAETVEEEAFCQERFGCRPVEYLEQLGWLGDDVWLAHCVHLSDAEVARFGETGTGVAHCPSSKPQIESRTCTPRDPPSASRVSSDDTSGAAIAGHRPAIAR